MFVFSNSVLHLHKRKGFQGEYYQCVLANVTISDASLAGVAKAKTAPNQIKSRLEPLSLPYTIIYYTHRVEALYMS